MISVTIGHIIGYGLLSFAMLLLGIMIGYAIQLKGSKCKHRFGLVAEETNVAGYRTIKVFMCKDCGKKKTIRIG